MRVPHNRPAIVGKEGEYILDVLSRRHLSGDGPYTELCQAWITRKTVVSVVRRFAPSRIILDVGGGNGFVSLGLTKAGLPSIVMEPGPQGAEIARADCR